MPYLNSSIILKPDGLFEATIRYSYLYFFVSEESEKFKTIKEAEDFIIKKRCPSHKVIVKEEDQIVNDNEIVENIPENVFEKDVEEIISRTNKRNHYSQKMRF